MQSAGPSEFRARGRGQRGYTGLRYMRARSSRPPGRRTLLLTLLILTSAAIAHPLVTAQRRTGPIVGQAVPRGGLGAPNVAGFLDAAARGTNYLPGEVLVKFRAGTTAAGQTRALAALRSRPSSAALRWHGRIARLRDASEPDAERLAAQLRTQPEVEYAQPNYIRRLPRRVASPRIGPITSAEAPVRIPNDPDFRELQWNFSLINAPGAWAINNGGQSSVIVAVLDTGFTTTTTTVTRTLWTGQVFESLPLAYRVSPDMSEGRITNPRDVAFEPGSPPFDRDGHGTHVASTIVEEANNGFGLAGLAYGVRLMPVKICVSYWDLMLERAKNGVPGFVSPTAGGCSDEDIISGIQYAVASGAHVINLSLGGPGLGPGVREALADAVAAGVFVAAAVGNSFDDGNPVEFPAGYGTEISGLMAVGGVGKSLERAYFSNTGTHVEIVAPSGSDFDDDGGSDEGFIWQVGLLPDDADPFSVTRPRFDRYVEVGYVGTSMATAHVSGLAALLISQGVTSPAAIESVIRQSATDLGPIGRDSQYGHGLIQARAAVFGLGIAR